MIEMTLLGFLFVVYFPPSGPCEDFLPMLWKLRLNSKSKMFHQTVFPLVIPIGTPSLLEPVNSRMSQPLRPEQDGSSETTNHSLAMARSQSCGGHAECYDSK